MDKKTNYKSTLNLPKTAFSMKANLAKREPQILDRWKEVDLYQSILEKNQDKEHFILHDGPPYANGDIHLGTALNKILKDIVVKHKSMAGYYSPFVPGWDCHGQPIEHEVEKKLGVKREKIGQVALRENCRKYALKFVDRQSEQFKRLGVIGAWSNPYLTLDSSYEATNVDVFGKLWEKGLIYKGKKPIYWCYSCKTALAEAEIEYDDEESPSIFVKFPLKGKFAATDKYPQNKYVLIWTTTPWTLPANVAIAVHPDFSYLAVRVGDEIYVLAEDLLSTTFMEIGISKYEVLEKFKGSDLEGMVCQHPFQDSESVIVTADFVLLDQGTGCVHIAPGHGQDDYMIGLKYDLPQPMPVDEKGIFTKEAGKFAKEHIFAANPLIIKELREQGHLAGSGSLIHSYPHCWRCKNSVIFRATEQWFISVGGHAFRQRALTEITKTKWVPEWSENRITAMVAERPDWCISRQRSWGVPIPVFYCDSCGETIVNAQTIGIVSKLFSKEGGDSWFIKSADEILSGMITCSCGGTEFSKESNILDVWFESGVSHFAVLRTRPELSWPADLYLEGSDQHRGWFQSSLLTSVGTEDKPPYKSVLTHGFLVDEDGRKMSKSLGNVISPLEVTDDLGADVLRLWVASGDYTSDIAVSKEILTRVSEAYRRIRNTSRFLLGNLFDFDPENENVEYKNLEEIDKWALLKLQNLIQKTTQYYNEYRFHLVYHALYNFCVKEMSAFYLDVLKDRLYTSAANHPVRKSAQTALYEILVSLTKMLAPVLVFTCEEIWEQLPDQSKREKSVHLSDWPEAKEDYFDKELEDAWDRLHGVRDEVLKALEIARGHKSIGNSLEAAVHIFAPDELLKFLKEYQGILPNIFIVSLVELASNDTTEKDTFNSENISGLSILIKKATGNKCERCWNFSDVVGKDKRHDTLCSRCIAVVEEG